MAIEIEFDEADAGTDKEIEFDSPVKQSLNYGLTKQPDQHSRIVSLADRERLPVDMVERNLPDLQARENRANLKIDQIEFDTPVAARALADPDTAAMSHDDLDNLTALERIYRKQESNTLASRHVRAVKRGTVGVGVAGEAIASYLDKAISGIGRMFLPKPRGISDAEWEKKQEKLNLTRGFGGLITASKAFGEIAPDEKIQEFSRLVDEAAEKQGTATAIFKGVGYLAQNPSVLSVLLAEQAAPMVLAAPIAPITGMLAKPLIAKITSEAARRYAERTVLMAGIQFSANMTNMYGQEIAQGINDGMTVDKALVRARTKSIAESGANAMFAFIPVGGGRVAQVSKETIKQGVAGATGAAVGSFAVGEDITLSEMMLEFFGEMTTAPADIALAAHSSQLDKRHEANIKEQTTLLTSNIDQMKLDELVNVAKANKLGDRNSERFGKFMQSVVAEYGEDAQVYIDGDQVADIIADMDADLPGVQEMQRQLDQGGDIAIPLESYIADISRSSAGESIRPHVRLDVDGLSQVELEEAVPQMEQRIKELMEKADLDAAETTRIDEITDQIFTQLMETGRVSTQIAKMSSQIIPAYIATKASEYGLTVDAMYEKLGFGGVKGPEGAVVLEPEQVLSQEPAFIEAPFLFVQARDKFLDTLAEDAESEEVLEAAEGFGPEYRNFIKALERNDWLGFDFPSQAIDAALSEEFENFDPSPGLKSAMGRMVNAEAATGRVFEQAGVEADPDIFMQPQQEPAKNGKRPPRATFDIDDRVITLLEQSDPTSFIHESGHLFLEMEKQLSAEFGVTDRQQAMLDWLGVESFDKVKVEHHEKFARGFEAYTFEGKAPSRDLAAVFASFRRWMLEIYKRITRLDVSLTPEVREFFDHMLATDAQIEEVRDNPAYEQFFRDAKSAGMTDAEWTEYQKRQEKSKNKATSTLEQKILKQMKRRYTREWKAEKKELLNEEMASLGEKPIYQAVKFIQTKDEEGQSRKLNSDSVKEMFDGKIPPKLLTMISKTGTMTPDDVALDHGYSSGHEMLTDIIDNPTQKQRAENTVEQRMISKHGDILNDGTIEQEARDAAQNEDKAKVLMIELRALNKQAGAAQDIDRAALKAGAERTIAAAKVSDIRPSRFYRAEIKAAQKAAAALEAGNIDEARGHKIQQLANHYLYREAVDAEKRVVTMRRYIAGVKTRKLNSKMVDPEYIHQMKILAAAYDFRTGKRSEDEAKAALLNLAGWVEAQMSSDNWIVPQFMDPTLSEMVAIKNNDALEPHEKSAAIEQLKIPRYSEMTMEQLRGAYDMIKNLRFVGGRLSKGEAEAFKQLTVETADSIIEHGGKNIPRPQEQSTAFKLISAIKQFGADHVVLGNTIAQMDGYQLFGPMFKAFYQQILDATNVELKLKRDIGEKLEEIFGKFKRKDLAKGFTESGNAGHRQITKTNGERWSLSRRGRLILAMYWGSPESRTALMIGNDISETDAIAMIGTLSKKELDFVQNIWDLNEGLWPQVRDTALKMTGVAPPKVEHVPYEVNGRTMPGGYIRLFYDYDARDSYLQDSGENGSLTRSGGHVMKNTRHGARNERVGSGGRPVSFELDNIFRALDESMHDIAFAETARDGTRFLQSKAVRNAIVLKYGKEVFESLNASMEGIIAGNFASNHPINSLLRYLRTNASYAMLGYSIRNVMQQPVAVTNVFGKIGEKYTLKGMAEFVFNPMKARARVEWIQERSEFMRKRTNLVNRDTSEILNKIGGSLMSGPLKRHAFDLQTMGDAIVAYPAWYGAYLKELDRSGSEKQAITFADESVAQTVGSGLMKDLSPMMQGSGQLKVVGPEMLKSITFMGSYFNKVANLTRDAFKENDLTTVRGGAEFTRQMAWYLMIPAVVSALIVDDLPGEDDDEGWLKWAGEKTLEYGLAQIFIIRDLVYLWNGFTPSTPYTRAVTEAGRTVKLTTAIVTGEKELSAEVLAKLTRNVSAFVPLPGAGQAARTIEGAVDASEKNNRNLYQMLVEGKERN
jgi:hypothetical protein